MTDSLQGRETRTMATNDVDSGLDEAIKRYLTGGNGSQWEPDRECSLYE